MYEDKDTLDIIKGVKSLEHFHSVYQSLMMNNLSFHDDEQGEFLNYFKLETENLDPKYGWKQ